MAALTQFKGEFLNMKFTYTPIDDITPYEKNPRIITQAAIDQAARSIAAFGFIKPIIVDQAGIILAGHTRLKAARQLGLTEVPVLWVDTLSDAQEKAYRIADNKLGENTQWDRSKFDKELEEIAARSMETLDALGLEQWELDRLAKADDVEADDDDAGDFIPASEYRAKKHMERTGRDDYIAEQAAKKPKPPAQIRVLLSIEDDIDDACMRRALGLSADALIPSVIKFSEVKA